MKTQNLTKQLYESTVIRGRDFLIKGLEFALPYANALRQLRPHGLNTAYIQKVFDENGVNSKVRDVTSLRTRDGYRNRYYLITATNGDKEVRYFASRPDILIEPLVYLSCLLDGFIYQPPRVRKQKDFDDLTYLHQRDVPSVQPVAFDRKKGIVIELFEEGRNLDNYLRDSSNSEDGKVDMCRQALAILGQAQKLGKHSGDSQAINFLVRTDGKVVIADMEYAFASAEQIAHEHELAKLVFSMARYVDPSKIVRLSIDGGFPQTMILNIPQYSQFVDSRTKRRVNAVIKEVL